MLGGTCLLLQHVVHTTSHCITPCRQSLCMLCLACQSYRSFPKPNSISRNNFKSMHDDCMLCCAVMDVQGLTCLIVIQVIPDVHQHLVQAQKVHELRVIATLQQLLKHQVQHLRAAKRSHALSVSLMDFSSNGTVAS